MIILTYLHGCNLSNVIGGALRKRDAQYTLNFLMDMDFTSDLAHFLADIGRGGASLLNSTLGCRGTLEILSCSNDMCLQDTQTLCINI